MYMSVSDFDDTDGTALVSIGKFGNRVSIAEVLELINSALQGSVPRESIVTLCALKVNKYATANSILPQNMTKAQLKSAIEATVLL